ncbi:hypothetical protein [Nocardia testacea]|uniref:hypothetical protein n=1 Tax=Nocardia testacea TaxID=248551 RepID=UPI0033F4AB25
MQNGNGSGALSQEQAARVTRAAGAARHHIDRNGFRLPTDERLIEILAELADPGLRTNTRFDPLLELSPFGLVLNRQPAVAVATGAGAVPLLIGTNTHEADPYLVPQGHLATSTAEDVHALAARCPRSDHAGGAYRARHPRASWGVIRSAMMGDALSSTGSDRLAEAHAAHGPTYTYEFARPSTAVDGRLGAAIRWSLRSYSTAPTSRNRTALAVGWARPNRPLHSPRACTGMGEFRPTRRPRPETLADPPLTPPDQLGTP